MQAHFAALKARYNLNMFKGYAFALLGGSFWGVGGTFMEFLYRNYDISPEWLTDMRLLIAGGLMSLMVIIKKGPRAFDILQDKNTLKGLLLFGIAGIMFCQYTYITAISYTNAPTATILQYIGPALVMLYICYKERRMPSANEILALCLVMIGIFLIATHGDVTNLVISKQGLYWGLASAVGLVIYNVLPGKMIKQWGCFTVIGFAMFIGAIFINIATMRWNLHADLDLIGYLALMFIIVFGTIISFTLYLESVNIIGAVRASLLSSIEPVSATVISVLWLGTSFTLMDCIGFVCIITTVFLLIKK